MKAIELLVTNEERLMLLATQQRRELSEATFVERHFEKLLNNANLKHGKIQQILQPN